MTLAARGKHPGGCCEIEDERTSKLDANQPTIALADDVISEKSAVFAHPEEVLDDQTLALADKRSLLASWASDALGVEGSPSLPNYRAAPLFASTTGGLFIARARRLHRNPEFLSRTIKDHRKMVAARRDVLFPTVK